MSSARTLIDKLWSEHEVARREDGATLLWVDRHYVHEGSFLAFHPVAGTRAGGGRAWGSPSASPITTFRPMPATARLPIRRSPAMVTDLETNTSENRVSLFGLRDPRQGIVHVVGPEQGLTLPGLPHRLRRQPYLHSRRVWRLCVRYRRVRGGARFDDADAVAKKALAHARTPLTGKTAIGIGAKDIALSIIARGRRRRRPGSCGGIRRQRHRGVVDGRPHDLVQHVD